MQPPSNVSTDLQWVRSTKVSPQNQLKFHVEYRFGLKNQLIHTTKHHLYKGTKVSSFEINIFGEKKLFRIPTGPFRVDGN